MHLSSSTLPSADVEPQEHATKRAEPPSPFRLVRLARFLPVVFPPAHFVSGALLFLSVYLGIQALVGATPLVVTWRVVPGIALAILSQLLMRAFDEIKDIETDTRLGKAGDPKYAGRPIVTGHILAGDLHALRDGLMAAFVMTALMLASPVAMAASALAFGVMWLSSKWFFWPAISKQILLAFATHNPIALLILAALASVVVADFGADALNRSSALLVMGLYLPLAAWEVSRKIRTPADETTYQTYSMVLGARAASAVALAFVVASSLCVATAFHSLADSPLASTSPSLRYVWLVPLMVVMAPCAAIARFVARPTTASSRLQPAFELYLALVFLVPTAMVATAFGLAWRS